jgi:CrcB protein
MEKVIVVGLGGFIGSVLRYGAGGLAYRLKGGTTFPFETLIINVLGCLAIGFLAAISESRGVFSGTTRAFLFIGVLGGFTTFSSFGYETFQLLRGSQVAAAALSVGLQIVLGVGAAWAGDGIARLVWRG